MTFVVTESCIKCKYTHCVDVCPTDAFREGPNFLAIEPDDCINCALWNARLTRFLQRRMSHKIKRVSLRSTSNWHAAGNRSLRESQLRPMRTSGLRLGRNSTC